LIYSENKKLISKVTLSNKNKVEAGLFVGSDGVNSKLRILCGIQAIQTYYDHVIFYNTFPIVDSVDIVNNLYVDNQFGLAYFYPISNTEFRLLVGFKKEEANYFLEEATVSEFKNRLKSFVTNNDDVLEKLESIDGFISFPLMKMNLDQYFIKNCLFVGNSAHSVHPITGQGMNTAIEDVDELMNQLNLYYQNKITLNVALKNYSSIRRTINDKVIKYGDNLILEMDKEDIFKKKLKPKLQSSSRDPEVLNSI